MNIIETALPGMLIIEPHVFSDECVFFMDIWNAGAFAAAGLDLAFVQDNHNCSQKGALRGLYIQKPEPQRKLVRVTSGAVFDVSVDLRASSPSLGQWVRVDLGAQNKRMIWAQEGFAYGLLTLEVDTYCLYKCTAPYPPASEQTLIRIWVLITQANGQIGTALQSTAPA